MTTITEDEIENLKAELDAARRLNAKMLDQVAECTRVISAERLMRDELLAALKECDEAMAYMSEYDIPVGLPARVKAAIAAAEATK